jgi:regulator of cell morphogenesis and NO signaling
MDHFEHINFNAIREADLLDFIEGRHHAFSKAMLNLMIRNFKSAYVSNPDIAAEIRDLISLLEQIDLKISRLISQEEESLFPFIRKLLDIKVQPNPIRFLNVKLLESSIRGIKEEHSHVEALMHSLKGLTKNFKAPLIADELLKLCFVELKEFIEECTNNLNREKDSLFPKLLALELEVLELSSMAIVGNVNKSNDD